MTSEDLRLEIRRFVAERDDKDPDTLPTFADSRNLFERGDIDSFGFVELLLHLSAQTGRDFDLANTDLSQLAVVGQLIGYFTNGSAELA